MTQAQGGATPGGGPDGTATPALGDSAGGGAGQDASGGATATPAQVGSAGGGADQDAGGGAIETVAQGGVGPDGTQTAEDGGSSADANRGGASDGRGGSAGDSAEAIPVATSGSLVVNELMPSNQNTINDEAGGYPDWLELYNSTTEDIDLGGYFISDSPDTPEKMTLASGLVVPAGGVLLLWADKDTEEGDNHLAFNLSRDGEMVLLSAPDGTVLDSVEFPYAETDTSYSRLPDGTGQFVWCQSVSPGELNGASCGG
ncbi:lamin tail domain-containing protein [Myxococcota bacterium]